MLSPCKYCTSVKGYKPDVKRKLGCHDSCKYYKKWKARLDKANKNRREFLKLKFESDITEFRHEHRIVLYNKKRRC